MANITIAGFPPQATLDKEDIIHVSRNGVDYRSTVGAASKDLPVGFIYKQLPNKQSPSELGLVGTWANISASFAGNFFRAEGGHASVFESGTQGFAMQGHYHQLANTTTARDGWGDIGVALGSGAYAPNTGIPGTDYRVTKAISDGTHGTVEAGFETRSINETIRIWERTA